MVPLMIMLPYDWAGYGIYEARSWRFPCLSAVLARLRGPGRLPRRAVHVPRGIRSAGLHHFFEKIQALEKRKPGWWQAFSDHPQTPLRILHSQEEIARICRRNRLPGDHLGVRRREGAAGAH